MRSSWTSHPSLSHLCCQKGNGAYLVIDDLAEPLSVTMEYKTIHANFKVMCNADFLDQTRLITQIAQRSHKPTVSVSALAHIVRRRSVNVELRVVEDIDHSLDSLGLERGLRGFDVLGVPQGFEAVSAPKLEVKLDVIVRVSVTLIDSTTLVNDLVDLGFADSRSLIVRRLGEDSSGSGRTLCDPLSVRILRNDGGSC